MCKCRVDSISLSFSVVIVLNLLLLVTTFNVDIFNYVQHKGPEQSMFGFSVATHKEHGRNWVIVGAPTSQGQQSRIDRGGVVYKCSTTSDNGCDEIDFHQEKSDRGRVIDDKNHQWFGATVSSAGPDGPVVACAPRYVWFTTSREERRDPVGTCYIAKDDFRKFSEYSPCRTSLFGYHRQGSCQAGFSSGISKDGKRLFVGAPGSWYWQGQMYSIDPMIKFPFHPGIFGEAFGFDAKGQLIQQSLDNRPAAISTSEGPATDDDSYLGYSMVVGDFNGEGVQGIAVGMPRGGDELQGKVLLYSWSLTNYLNITGEQLGAYFGYAVAASDVDGDGRDDIIIGAPLHTEPNTEKKYEMGRVHIFYQGYGNYTKKTILDGKNSKARFGLSLCTLGDINLDGYGDFAVGAPYDGPNEAGAVYIFQGSANGVISKYTQVIYAETVQMSYTGYTPLSTFGFSLSGGLDLDGNDYPDLAIGAYQSDTAYFFRSRPVVKVHALIRFLPDGVRTINLDDKKCPKPHSTAWVSCIETEVCLSYTGIGTPSRIELDLHYNLDSRKTGYSRMRLGTDPGKYVNKTVVLFKDSPENCQERHMIYLEEKIVDKLTDLEVEVSYALRESLYFQQTQRDPRSILVPIVDLTRPAVVNDSISIFKNCGSDNVCIPDLQLFVNTTVDRYLYEVGKALEFNVMISNIEDDSYNTKFYVHFPRGITFKVANKDDGSKLSCSSINETLWSCDIGNPLPKDSVVRFKLEVEPLPDEKIFKPTYDFFMNVTSANPEKKNTLSDNSRHVAVDIWVNAVLAIEGRSTPKSVYYNGSQYRTVSQAKWDNEIGPQVIHSYTVTNTGPSDVEEVEIFIIWPYATLADEDLLYLLEAPHTLDGGGVKCDAVDYNYREFVRVFSRNVWDIINIHKGIDTSEGGGTNIEIKTPRPGQIESTITRTLSNVTFYNLRNEKLDVINVIGSKEGDEYWEKIVAAAIKYNEPLYVDSNSSDYITSYVNGKEKVTIKDTRPDDPLAYARYRIDANVTTVIRYYRSPGNLIASETIREGTGSAVYNDHIRNAKQRWGQPLIIETETTRFVECRDYEGKLLHHDILTAKGKETMSGTETTITSYYTVVTFYNSDGSEIKQEITKEEPKSQAYWEQIGNIISKFQIPVYFTTNTTKIIEHSVNGEITRVQRVPETALPFEQSINADVKSTITVTITTARGEVHSHVINAVKGSEEFNKQYNEIINRYVAPFRAVTEIIVTITYRNANKQPIHIGTVKETTEQTYTITQTHDQTNRTTTITAVLFYDHQGNLVHKEELTEEPQSSAFWEKINKIITGFQQQIQIRMTTKTIITFYVNGHPIKTQEVGRPAELTYASQKATTLTTIKVYNSRTNEILQEGTIPVEVGTAAYQDYINKIIRNFRSQPITILIRTTYRITYLDSSGRVIYTGTSYKEEQQSHNENPTPTTSQTRIVTTILFYGPSGNLVHRETISDQPGTAAYWERVKNAIVTFNVPLNIYTNTSRTVTYYVDGVESHTQHFAENAGVYESPFTAKIEITNVITFYDGATNRVIDQRNVNGELSAEERSRLLAEFVRTYRGQVKMETVTTKKITYRARDGNVLHTDSFQLQPAPPTQDKYRTEVTTETTLTVYGPDRRNVIHQETIQGEPGSEPYNNAIANIIGKYPGSITIYTNSTKTITYYNAEGRSVNRETVPEPRSTVHREGSSTYGRGTTSITFYGADGKPIHREDIEGLLGSELNSRLNELSRGYEELIKNYGTQLNVHSSDGGSVSFVDTPYPGNRPTSSGHHFTDFDNSHNQGQSQWGSSYNRSYHYNDASQSGGGYNQGQSGSFNLQDLNVNQDLGRFAKKDHGFRTGGVDLGVSSGVIDHNVDGAARSNVETFSRTSYDGNNYLGGGQTHYRSNRDSSKDHHKINKREIDTTDSDIKKLSNCTTSKCIAIRCVTGPLRNRAEVHFALRARIVVQTLKNISMTQPVDIQSMLLARISHFHEIKGSPAQRTLYRQQVVTSVMAPKPDVKPYIVPLWVVILSAVAGTLILLLLIFLLHKCGFFKRNRPSDAPERQPLNRNGHFQHGDEAL